MFLKVQVFQGPGFSGSRFLGSGSRVRVQGPGSGSRVWIQVTEVANFQHMRAKGYRINVAIVLMSLKFWTDFV